MCSVDAFVIFIILTVKSTNFDGDFYVQIKVNLRVNLLGFANFISFITLEALLDYVGRSGGSRRGRGGSRSCRRKG